jgi:hypothetical protein
MPIGRFGGLIDRQSGTWPWTSLARPLRSPGKRAIAAGFVFVEKDSAMDDTGDTNANQPHNGDHTKPRQRDDAQDKRNPRSSDNAANSDEDPSERSAPVKR